MLKNICSCPHSLPHLVSAGGTALITVTKTRPGTQNVKENKWGIFLQFSEQAFDHTAHLFTVFSYYTQTDNGVIHPSSKYEVGVEMFL